MVMERQRFTAWLSTAVLALVLLAGGGCESNRVLRDRGESAMRRQELDVAQSNFSRALTQDPTDWRAHLLMGQLRLRQERYLDARLEFEKAWSLNPRGPETPDLLDDLAEAIYRQGDLEALHKMLDTTTTQYRTSRDYLRQARYLAGLGDIDAARVALAKAQRLAGPTDAQPFIDAADFYDSIGDSTAAVTALRRAYGVDPKNEQVGERLRKYGVVPGPAAALPRE